MAWGISPYTVEVIPLDDYNPDFYLTLIYRSIENMGWHVGYFDHDGIIAYTNISFASYSEEISVRIKDNTAVIKSECVGFQGFFTDYGKNQKNLDLLFAEIDFTHYLLQENLEENTQELMNAVPEKQFLSLDEPPMAGKETLHGFFTAFIPKKYYTVTPILVLVNIFIYFVTGIAIAVLFGIANRSVMDNGGHLLDKTRQIYLMFGFSNRETVLNGEVWRLLTSTFLHFSLLHVGGNMIALIYIGSLLESKLGKLNYLLLYLCTGIIGSMASVMWHDDNIAAGASGAIFGLFGILLALASTNFYEKSARRALLISTAIFVAYNIIPIGKSVDHAAHFGGLISGYVFGLITYFTLKSKDIQVQKWAAPVIACLVVIVFVSAGMKLSPKYQLKQYKELTMRTAILSDSIRTCFYEQSDLTRQQQQDTLDQRALPCLATFNKLSVALNKLVLPAKKKKEADDRAKLIILQCHYYKLLYLEFKEDDKIRYRHRIAMVTDTINDVREDIGKLDED